MQQLIGHHRIDEWMLPVLILLLTAKHAIWHPDTAADSQPESTELTIMGYLTLKEMIKQLCTWQAARAVAVALQTLSHTPCKLYRPHSPKSDLLCICTSKHGCCTT